MIATWIKDTLEEGKVPYQELHHPEAFTAQTVAQQEHFSGHHVAKVVIAMADDRPVELVVPASRRVDLEGLRRLLGADRVRLATEDEIKTYFTDCEPGAVPPLRHWENVNVVMDPTLQTGGDILFQAGTHQDAIRLRFEDWLRMVQPKVGSFTEPAEAGSRKSS